MPSPHEQADALGDRLVAIEQSHSAAIAEMEAGLAVIARGALGADALTPAAWSAIRDSLLRLLAQARPGVQSDVSAAQAEGWTAGLGSAEDAVSGVEVSGVARPALDAGVGRIFDEQMVRVQAALQSSKDIPAGLAVAKRTVHRSRTALTYNTNREAGQAVTEVARENGLHRRWVAERDACLHCLAYQGTSTTPGRPWPGGLTFDTKPLSSAVVDGTPLHPFCRCITQLHDPADTEVLVALKREARRSVAKGWSLPGESESARLRAADKLLREGAGLPKTVEEAARRAVKRGGFGTRAVPTR